MCAERDINAQLREVQIRILSRAKPTGTTVDLKNVNKKLSLIATITETGGDIEWEENMRRWLQATGAIEADPYPKEPPGARPRDNIGG